MILIVDDEPSVRMAMERWFKLRGFETDTAVDGVEAVEKCLANNYEVVTMDVEMPRMNGLDAVKHIHRERPETPIIILTGFVRDVEQLKEISVREIVIKPIRMPDLEVIIRRVIGQNSQ